MVPEHVAELGVDPALYGVVGARQWTLCGQGRVKVGKERSLRDESRERRPRPPEPLVGEDAPAVDVGHILEEVRPERAPLQVALHPPVRLAGRLEVHELDGERVELPARLEPRSRRRVPPYLAEDVEQAPLDSRARPRPPPRSLEARPAVTHHHVRRRDRIHQRPPRPTRLRLGHVPRDHVPAIVRDQHDEVAGEPDAVDEEHPVDLAGRLGHGPHPPEPGGPPPVCLVK